MSVMIPMQNNLFLMAIVDDEDAERVLNHGWSAEKRKYTYYATTAWRENGKVINCRLHRFVTGRKKGKIVDHRDRNGLDCTKGNLRFVTKSQNTLNRECVAGNIGIRIRGNKFEAHIVKNGKQIYLGMFNTHQQAVLARDEAARKLHGSFAVLNG